MQFSKGCRMGNNHGHHVGVFPSRNRIPGILDIFRNISDSCALSGSRPGLDRKEKKMTYKEKLLQEHPELASSKVDITKFACPDSYGYEEYSECDGVEYGRIEDGCEACWNREMTKEDKP